MAAQTPMEEVFDLFLAENHYCPTPQNLPRATPITASTIQVKAMVYGHLGIPRLEIEMEIPIPHKIKTLGQLSQWEMFTALNMIGDLKFSHDWGCAACNAPARENINSRASAIHLPQPQYTVFAHPICSTRSAPCIAYVDRQTRRLLPNSTGMDDAREEMRLNPNQPVWGLNSSCAECESDLTAGSGHLQRCSGCGLTRYCSRDCQKADYSRHKMVCQASKSIKLFVEDNKVLVRKAAPAGWTAPEPHTPY